MFLERYTNIEHFEILLFELEASGWCGSIRLVEAVLTKLVGHFGNTGKSKMAAKLENNIAKPQKTPLTPVSICWVYVMIPFS